MAERWQDIENDREKYAAYLCSREWSELKNIVHTRSRGMCERRKKYHSDAEPFRCPLPGNAVHHLTYARKYHESPEDLIHYCDACHDFTHGKSDFDPIEHIRWCRYILACDRPPVDSVIAFFGGTSPEWVRELLGKHPHVYSMLVLHDATSAFGREDNVAAAYDLDGEVTLVIEPAAVMEQTIELIERSIGLPFELAKWLRFGSPTIDHELYDESLKQIAKCLNKARAPRRKRGGK